MGSEMCIRDRVWPPNNAFVSLSGGNQIRQSGGPSIRPRKTPGTFQLAHGIGGDTFGSVAIHSEVSQFGMSPSAEELSMDDKDTASVDFLAPEPIIFAVSFSSRTEPLPLSKMPTPVM